LTNPNFSFLDFCFIANPDRRWLATSPRNPKLFVDDLGKLYRQRRHATQAEGLETLDPKAKVEGPSESPRESPPPSPKQDQPQPPPMGEQLQPERKIELCTPDIVDLPIINLQDAGWPFEIKVSTIRMVQHLPFTSKENLNLHLQVFVQLCQIFDGDGVTQDQMRVRLFLFSLLGKAFHWFHTLPTESKQDWEVLMRNFMKEVYSPTKTQSLRNKVDTFVQFPMEMIEEASAARSVRSTAMSKVNPYLMQVRPFKIWFLFVHN
jgi:hypothetical protein